MSNNTIYEVTQMLGDRKTIENDMAMAMDTVTRIFRDKYIKKLQDTVLTHKKIVTQSNPREAGLLRALKPFIHENYHTQIDKMIDVVILFGTAKNMNNDISQLYSQQLRNDKPIYSMSNDSSVHSDGVYEVDEKCLLQKRLHPTQESTYNLTNMLLILTLMRHI